MAVIDGNNNIVFVRRNKGLRLYVADGWAGHVARTSLGTVSENTASSTGIAWDGSLSTGWRVTVGEVSSWYSFYFMDVRLRIQRDIELASGRQRRLGNPSGVTMGRHVSDGQSVDMIVDDKDTPTLSYAYDSRRRFSSHWSEATPIHLE